MTSVIIEPPSSTKPLKPKRDESQGSSPQINLLMKKFIVFAFSQYYPSGGMNDVKGSFDYFEYAEALVQKYKDDDYYDHYQIFNAVTREWKIY